MKKNITAEKNLHLKGKIKIVKCRINLIGQHLKAPPTQDVKKNESEWETDGKNLMKNMSKIEFGIIFFKIKDKVWINSVR